MIGIYKITNNVNNKIYIGQSIDIDRRFKEHIRASKLNKDNMAIHKAMFKYGIENFTLTVLEECEISELDSKESYYIETLSARIKTIGYNICQGGCLGPVYKGIDNANSVLTEEIVAKIRYLYLEGYVKKQAYERINRIFPININTFNNVWTGKTYKDICYHVYDVSYKESIKKFRSINKSKLCNTNSKQYVLEIRNCRASGEQLTECYESKFKDKISIWIFKDIWYNRTYSYIKASVEDSGIKNKKSYKRNVPVSQFTKDGQFIKNFDGIIDALLEVKGEYNKNMINHIYCNCLKESKSAYGYVWKFNNCND